MPDNYYDVLRIAPTANEATVRDAIKQKHTQYRRRTGHPDQDIRQDAERKMRSLNEAEKVLLDAAARSAYAAPWHRTTVHR
jgi:DnaJ-class molecular chaperone